MNQLLTPSPSLEEEKISRKLTEIIIDHIKRKDGFLPFDEYVNLVLYFPTLGYYTGNKKKIGIQGDFITGPDLHSIFAHTLAEQIIELLPHTKKNIYELGAGTGNLAADLLNVIPENLLENYYIIDISGYLIRQQLVNIQQKAPLYAYKVKHLDHLPSSFEGVIIGNEVLDAIAFNLVKKDNGELFELGVGLSNKKSFILNSRSFSQSSQARLLLSEAEEYLLNCPEPYQTELHIQQKALIKTLCERMGRAAAIFIDYGFDAGQYYHPQRSMGTIMGHYRHHSILDPFFYPGLVDITCHVNFSTIADSIVNAKADLVGYLSQALFLMNLNIMDKLAEINENASQLDYLKASSACQTLINPHEMGELFKVIAFAKNIEIEWQGFKGIDWTHKL